MRQAKTWAWAAAAAATLGICVATLHSGFGPIPPGWSFYLTTGDAALAELIANLILFIPLGVALTLAGVKPMRVIAAGALRGVAPGDTFTAATWHDSTDICLRVNTTQRCGLGYTIGDGWKLIYYPASWGPWQLALINTLWLAGCVTGVGFWSVTGKKAAIGRIAIAIAILGSVIVPIATHLNATPLNEFLGVIGGIVLGRWLARITAKGQSEIPDPSAAGYTTPPSHPGQTS